MSDVVSTNPQERALLQREGLDTLGGAFDYSGGTGRPHVLLFEGKRVLSRSAMEYG